MSSSLAMVGRRFSIGDEWAEVNVHCMALQIERRSETNEREPACCGASVSIDGVAALASFGN